MAPGLGLKLGLGFHLSCRVCKRHLGGKADAMVEAALFGVSDDIYATCPACLKEVVSAEMYHDPSWRRAVRQFLVRRKRKGAADER